MYIFVLHSELLVTCNTDNSIRLWKDLKTSKVVTAAYISHYCEELPLAVSVSPDGFRVLVAFSKHIRYRNGIVIY